MNQSTTIVCRILFAGLALAVTASPAHALNPFKAISQYVHAVWDTDQGLPQNSITAILQTRDGYIWFGTQEALLTASDSSSTTGAGSPRSLTTEYPIKPAHAAGVVARATRRAGIASAR